MINRVLSAVERMASGFGLKSVHQNIKISGVSIDTRSIQPGNLYVPIIGEKFNGHDFIESAKKNGAVAAFWQKSEPNPPSEFPLIYVDDTLVALQALAKSYRDELSIKVVGITGSNGKTTTKDMVAAVLSTTYKVHKTEGNFNNHFGLPLTILRLEESTEIAVLEMGMSGKGEIKLLSEIARPDVAIITNIGEAHLLDLGSREGIAEAKLEIIEGLSENGVFVYHGEEPLIAGQVQKIQQQKITFGSSNENDYFATSYTQEQEGTYFSVNQYPTTTLYIPVLGKHNVNNALAAVATARILNVSWEHIEKGLQAIKITNMRLELIEGKNDIKMINDAYNASPTSMAAAIDLLKDLKGYKRKIVVLGDMLELGKREVEFHREIGRLLNPDLIDFVFTFGTLGEQIAVGASGKFPPNRVIATQNKERLIEELEKRIGPGDLLLVKGSRGMKLEDVVIALKLDFKG